MLSVRWETAGDVGGAALKRKAGALVEIGDFLGKFGADLGRAASPTALDLLELGEKNTGLRRLAEERMLEALSRAIEESGGRGGKLVGLHGDRLWRVYLGERTPTRLDFGARWAEGSGNPDPREALGRWIGKIGARVIEWDAPDPMKWGERTRALALSALEARDLEESVASGEGARERPPRRPGL